MQASTSLVRNLIVKNAGILSRAYGGHGNAHHRSPSFNDLPVPEGDWHEANQAKQSKYNATLAGSILLFAGIVAFIQQTKVIDFNYSPPKTYE